MVRITVRHARVGMAGASSLLALGNAALGCAIDGGENVDGTSQSATAIDPGAGTFDLQRIYYGSNAPEYALNTTNTTDEFVRVGEKVTLTAPVWLLWQIVSNTGDVPDLAHAEAYKIAFTVQFMSAGAVLSTKNVKVTSFTGDQFYNLVAHAQTFVIPQRTDAIAIGVTVTDPSTHVTKSVAASDVVQIPVFGGEGKKRHVVFDNMYQALRTRVVEGGNPKDGSDAVITYTDWRADTLVDKSSLDRQIGTAIGYSRFGSFEMPIYGDIQYEVSYGLAFDDAWSGETSLASTTTSRVLPTGRTGFEADVAIPRAARKMDVYFHVKAILVVDYSKWGDVRWRKYNQGDRIMLRERWDNPNGQAGQNYELPIDAH